MGFLLGLIPAPWLAVLKGLPWRLIGWIVAGAVAIWFILLVNTWRLDSNRLEATEKALAASEASLGDCQSEQAVVQQAVAEAQARALITQAADRRAAQEVEHDLQTKLAAAGARDSDLSRRLHDYQIRRCPGPVPAAPGAPGQSAASGGEPGGASEIDRRTDEYHAACDRDAIATDGWWQWWQTVESQRKEPGR